ncbi:hypothetical protein SAMN04488029_2070 [Reichenbachiella faecimaris]|uniref:Pyrimidine dimer DNA glycosylase /DNA-(Apurinic or apyrimidinic site) lyase n=1 Tax=Reichenbachiella faecimaris TaxID=692418 RepID=A0A1W2GDJ3_REIFA|nr:pyrimidine dimer DNA glycosylase/endonuclease V [Reichenbachiella faecimaris]SMD34552.1 hypothetical protein SAMN04488029_2070 [Reichenbachiella faecimaris]
MRIWSIHPRYLDAKGLVALWRETLLAKHVLEGKTKGYKNHPQLIRFKALEDPLAGINLYLKHVFDEACQRGYNFDSTKFSNQIGLKQISVTTGQMTFEKEHLLRKLEIRDMIKFNEYKVVSIFDQHPIFKIVEGDIEPWEVIT